MTSPPVLPASERSRSRIASWRAWPSATSASCADPGPFLLFARFWNAFSSSISAMRSSVAAKFMRRVRSTVTFRYPKSSLSNTLLTTRGRVRGSCVTGSSSVRSAGLAVLEVAVDAGEVVDLFARELVALVAEALTHLHEELPPVDELHLALSPLFLAVGEHPDVCGDAGVVEELVWQRHDRLEPVVLDDPLADAALTAAGVTREQRRAVEDDGDTAPTAAVLGYGLHLRQHVLQKTAASRR